MPICLILVKSPRALHGLLGHIQDDNEGLFSITASGPVEDVESFCLMLHVHLRM